MKYVKILLFMVIAFLSPSFLIFFPAEAEKKNSGFSKEKILKEVKELNTSLQKIQEKILVLNKHLASLAPTSTTAYKTKDNLSLFDEYFNKLNGHFKGRLQEFAQGSKEVLHLFNRPPTGEFSLTTYVLCFIGIVFISIFMTFFVKKIILQILKKMDPVSMARKNAPLSIVAVLTGGVFLPLFLFHLLSAIIFSFLKYLGLEKIYLDSFYSFLPFNIYFFWAGFFWVRWIFSPNRPSKAILPLDSQGAYYGALWIKVMLSSYFIGSFFLLLAEVLQGTATTLTALSDAIGLVVGLTLLKALLFTKQHLIPHVFYKSTFRGLNLLRFLVGMGCGLWLVNRQWFYFFLIPTCIGLWGLALIAPLQNFLRWVRISSVWKRRHKDFFLKRLLLSRSFLEQSVSYGIVLGIGTLWSIYLWNFFDLRLFEELRPWVTSLMQSPFMGNLLNAGVIFFIAVFMVKIGERILRYYVEDRHTNETNNFLASRLKTLMAMLRTLLRIVVWVPSISIIFSQFGNINITAWVTSLGAASFGLTFGFQTIVRDFITGFFIILENNLMVGDEVEVDGRSGQVEEITMRTLKIRSDNGMLLTIPFGTIMVIGNKNRLFSALVLNVSVDYGEQSDKVHLLVEKAFSMTKKTPIIGKRILGSLEFRGVTEVTSYSMIFQLKIRTVPNLQESVRRAFTRHLKTVFDEAGVRVPVPPPLVASSSSLTQTRIL